MENIVPILKRNRRRRGKKESGFLQLFISKRIIQGAATALLGIFVPIFLYEVTGHNFYIVGNYYALLSFLYALLLVPGMWVTNRLGFSRTLVLGSACSVVLYILMYFMNETNYWLILPPLTIAIVAFRIFHWVPYHVDFTLFTSDGERGRVVSLSMATIAFLGVIGPILAGFIIDKAGYDALFAVAIVLLMAATISYAFVPETPTKFTWTYRQTLQKMFSRNYSGVAMGEFANGIEVAVTTIVWPIFLYEILNGNVFEIGAVSTIIVAVTIVLQLMIGKYLDAKKGNHQKALRVGSTLYAIGWILKIFVLSTAQVFFVGLYHNVVKIFTKTPFSAILYDMSADQGKYVDEFTVVREMSGHAGRALALFFIAILTLYIPIGWTFVLAALASLALNMVYRVAASN
jgi:MFS family permease